MRRPDAIIAAAVVALCAMTACGAPDNDYSGYTDLPADGWLYGDTVSYVATHTDTVATGDIIVSLRYAADYPYRNVWLEVTAAGPDSVTPVRRDTVMVELRDKYGRPHGKGIGISFQLSDTVARGVTHTSGAPLGVRHIMRVDTLRGIEQIGISFVEQS